MRLDNRREMAPECHIFTFQSPAAIEEFKHFHQTLPDEHRMVGTGNADRSPNWLAPHIAVGDVLDTSKLIDYAATHKDVVQERNQPARLAGATRSTYRRERPLSWGLDRIDQTQLPLDHIYDPPGDGCDVNVYILDTGIDPNRQFGCRLKEGWSVFDYERDTRDNSNHGTLVAGIVGSARFGVAPECNLYPVKVWGQEGGSTCTICQGIGWVMRHRPRDTTAIINLSVYVPGSKALDSLVECAVEMGIVFVVAAGNDADDVNSYSPARLGGKPGIITVGATYEYDAMWENSNEGEEVSLLAPGVGITAFDIDDFTGTSAAAPHVAGVAAIYLAANRWASPEEVKCRLLDCATPDVLQSVADSPNLLLYSQVL
jgi:subtilisin family serine protease